MFIIGLSLASLLVCSLLPHSSVNAASQYDNLLSPLPRLQLTSENGMHTRDFSTNWPSIINQTCPTGVGDSLLNAMASGGSWTVWKYNESNDIRVMWRQDRTVS